MNIDFADKGCTALMIAFEFDNIDMIKLLIKNGANTNIKNILGETCYDYVNCDETRKEILEYIKD